MSNTNGEPGVADVPNLVLSTGLVLVVLLFLPGLANPFVIPKESLLCMVSAFALFLIATGRHAALTPWPWQRIALLLSPVLLVTVAAPANGVDLLTSNGLVRLWCYVLFFLAVRLACPSARSAVQLTRVAALLGGVEGGVVILQVLFGHTVLDVSGLPSAKWRAFGTLGNPNWVGAYLAASLPLAISAAHSAARKSLLLGWWLVTATIMAGLALTLSRGAWIAGAVGVGLLAISLARIKPGDGRADMPESKRRLSRTVAIIAASALLAAAITWASFGSEAVSSAVTRRASIEGRLRMWRVTAAMIAERPLRGWGPGRFAGVYPAYQRAYLQGPGRHELVSNLTDHPHNEYLYLAAEAGVCAALALLAMLFVGLRQPRAGSSRAEHAAVVAGLGALAIFALGDVPLRLPATTALFCVLLVTALTLSGPLESRSARRLTGPERIGLLLLAGLALAQGGRLLLVDRHLVQARQALRKGEVSIAEQSAEWGLTLDPGQAELWHVLAHARAARGDDEGALSAAERGRMILPGPQLTYLVAEVERRRGAPQRALAALRELSATLPGLLRPRLLMGELYAEMGQLARARAELHRLLMMPSQSANSSEVELRARAARALLEMEANG